MPKRLPGLPRGIRMRGTAFHVDCYRKGRRITGTADTLEEAKALKEKLLDQLAGKSTWNLRYVIDQTYTHEWTDCRAGEKLKMNAEAAAAFFGEDTLLSSITTDHIFKYIGYLRSPAVGNSNATINRKLAALSKLFRFAMMQPEASGITTRPHFKRQQEGGGRIRFLTAEEEHSLLSFLKQIGKESQAEACVVLVDTGLRGGELWRLEARDVNFSTGLLSVWQSKNAKPRSVPMTQRVRTILSTRAKAHPSGSLFPDCGHDLLEHSFTRWKKSIGLTDDKQLVPYALRHTCASRLVQRGVHLRVVQEWLGHKTLSITMRYSHLAPANLSEAAKVLEGFPHLQIKKRS